MAKRRVNENDINKQSERLTPTALLHKENARLHEEVNELRRENKLLYRKYMQQKPHVVISKYGDFLLATGAIGFGTLGNCNSEMFGKIGNVDWYSVLLGATFFSAIAGLILKYARLPKRSKGESK